MAPSVIMSFKPFNPSQTKWMNWVKRLEVAFALSKVTSEEKRKKMLIYHMGMETFETLIEIIAPAELSELSYADIVGRLTLHYDPEGEPQPTETQNCLRFWQRHQQPDEDARSFMEALQDLLAACEFKCDHCDARNRILRNQFVSGLKDSLIQETLAKEANLTDERALEMAKKMEKSQAAATAAPVDKSMKKFIEKNCYQCTHRNVKNPENWHLIFLKEFIGTDWTEMMKALKAHGASGINICGIQHMNKQLWMSFAINLRILVHLNVIFMRQCPADVIRLLMENCSDQLTIMNAESVQTGTLDLSALPRLKNLEELRINMEMYRHPIQDLKPLARVTGLKHLVLVGFENLSKANVEVIGDLILLESLEIGSCCDLSGSFYNLILAKLKRLKRLRIVHAVINTTAILNTVAIGKLPALRELELVNFEINSGFSDAMARCKNLKSLLMAPIYSRNNPVDFSTILTGVGQLSSSLKVFTWVITEEVIQIADKLAKAKDRLNVNLDSYMVGNSIAVQGQFGQKNIVDIRAVTELTNIFKAFMPYTHLLVTRMPFKHTWKASTVHPSKAK